MRRLVSISSPVESLNKYFEARVSSRSGRCTEIPIDFPHLETVTSIKFRSIESLVEFVLHRSAVRLESN